MTDYWSIDNGLPPPSHNWGVLFLNLCSWFIYIKYLYFALEHSSLPRTLKIIFPLSNPLDYKPNEAKFIILLFTTIAH